MKTIKHFSKKRAKENRKYLKARNTFLEKRSECEAGLDNCQGIANQIHHIAGRLNDKLTDVSNFLPVCQNCHDAIHFNPVLSMKQGLMKTRLTKVK